MAFLPARFRGEQPVARVNTPSWLSKKVTPFLEAFARLSSSRPIYTVTIVAALASTSYIGLLEDGSFGSSKIGAKPGWSALEETSQTLRTGEDTAWTWQAVRLSSDTPEGVDHLALLTLDFSEQTLSGVSAKPPTGDDMALHWDARILPTSATENASSTYLDPRLVLSLPYNEASRFVAGIQEIPGRDGVDINKPWRWVMRALGIRERDGLTTIAKHAWTDFSDLIRHAQPLDIAIMVLGYIAMHVTLVSLFQSMRRMGSQFWLAANALFSSLFAFLLGLFVTHKFGVHVPLLVIAEGLPFLVVIVGFEKNIVLTRCVLSHALENLKPNSGDKKNGRKQNDSSSFTQAAIKAAMRENGYEVAKAYAIEIAVLIVGASSGVKGGLQKFCFLAAWVLLFDCTLLFSFYAAVLCIKLEVTRIRRYNELRKVLEDDGIDDRVAEDVAQSSDWPRADGDGLPGRTIFGKEIKSKHVHNYKVVMVSGFLLINAYNLYTVQVRGAKSVFDFSSWPSRFAGVPAPQAFNPIDATSRGLEYLLTEARLNNRETSVTMLRPITYEPVFRHLQSNQSTGEVNDTLGDLIGDKIGSQVVGGLLKSLEDPILSKWIVAALALSVALNGYLFNAATSGIQDPPRRPIDREELAHAQDFNIPETMTNDLGERKEKSLEAPPTPPSSDDETNSRSHNKAAGGSALDQHAAMRSQPQMEKILADDRAKELIDEEAIDLSLRGKIPGYALEKKLGDFTRAVKVRRATIARNKATSNLTESLEYSKLPYREYNWGKVFGACCENVIGYMPLPVGVAGPLVIDGQSYFIPMATTEGVLVASASRGCKAINSGGGAVTVLTDDGMTRGPCVSFENLERAGAAKLWLDSEAGQRTIKHAFNSTSRFARLDALKTVIAGTKLYIRFKTTTGDAMGMNMISKGVEHALTVMMDEGFDDMNVVSVSGNYCADKKAAALNWIEGRGKSVVAEAIIPGEAIKSILKTDVDSLVDLNISKNLIGSAMAGAAGGFNAHAANIVAAVFIATGQDPAQVVESANCITIMQK